MIEDLSKEKKEVEARIEKIKSAMSAIDAWQQHGKTYEELKKKYDRIPLIFPNLITDKGHLEEFIENNVMPLEEAFGIARESSGSQPQISQTPSIQYKIKKDRTIPRGLIAGVGGLFCLAGLYFLISTYKNSTQPKKIEPFQMPLGQIQNENALEEKVDEESKASGEAEQQKYDLTITAYCPEKGKLTKHKLIVKNLDYELINNWIPLDSYREEKEGELIESDEINIPEEDEILQNTIYDIKKLSDVERKTLFAVPDSKKLKNYNLPDYLNDNKKDGYISGIKVKKVKESNDEN